MAEVVTRQGAENRQYLRRLLMQKQPGFAVTLELALMLAEQELWPSGIPSDISAGEGS